MNAKRKITVFFIGFAFIFLTMPVLELYGCEVEGFPELAICHKTIFFAWPIFFYQSIFGTSLDTTVPHPPLTSTLIIGVAGALLITAVATAVKKLSKKRG